MRQDNRGHRWTDEELKKLIYLWIDGTPIPDVATAFCTTVYAIEKQVVRMRKLGVPLPHRTVGQKIGARNRPWTPEDIVYVVRRRKARISSEQIASELGRTRYSIQAIIRRINQAQIPIQMLGSGNRRFWNPDNIRALLISEQLFGRDAEEESE